VDDEGWRMRGGFSGAEAANGSLRARSPIMLSPVSVVSAVDVESSVCSSQEHQQ